MNKRCVIFTAYQQDPNKLPYAPQQGDYLLCADGGYAHCVRHGITPHAVIGDCDSTLGFDPPAQLLHIAPREKDDTDTMLCAKHALELNYKSFLIIGGIGGRFDHTLANIQTIAFLHKNGARAELIDAFDRTFFMENETRTLNAQRGCMLSLFAYSNECAGVSISGVKYPLKNARLTQFFPLGVSNQFVEEKAEISVEEGLLLVVLSKILRS
ncbi:thiamine diphosphokinase [Eubacteriales bacterium OttesenSCG-928-K08]|nr:thiamine diphosphokinase [Eubacteriales bacterium OttesenSCG-928-K08]